MCLLLGQRGRMTHGASRAAEGVDKGCVWERGAGDMVGGLRSGYVTCFAFQPGEVRALCHC